MACIKNLKKTKTNNAWRIWYRFHNMSIFIGRPCPFPNGATSIGIQRQRLIIFKILYMLRFRLSLYISLAVSTFSHQLWSRARGGFFREKYQIARARVYLCVWIFKQSMEPRNRVRIRLSYWPARLHRQTELTPWNRFLGSLNVLKYGLWCLPPHLLQGFSSEAEPEFVNF